MNVVSPERPQQKVANDRPLPVNLRLPSLRLAKSLFVRALSLLISRCITLDCARHGINWSARNVEQHRGQENRQHVYAVAKPRRSEGMRTAESGSGFIKILNADISYFRGTTTTTTSGRPSEWHTRH